MFSEPTEWLAFIAVLVPLCTLAWSAFRYVSELKRSREQREYERVFHVMDHLGQPGGSIASKMAAAYELRKYKAYAPVIIRLCDGVKVDGPSAQMLLDELQRTKDHLKK